MNRKLFVTVALLAAAAAPAAAQDAIMALNPTTMIGYAGTTAANAYRARDFGGQIGRAKPKPKPNARAATAAPSPAAVIARTSFKPDPAVRDRVFTHAAAALAQGDPKKAAQLKAALVSSNLRTAALSYMGRYGLSPNNVVDTTTLYLASAWFASRADGGDPTPAQMKGLQRQVAQTYAGMPQVLAASPAAKQDLADTAVIQAALAGSLANQAASDPKMAGQVRASVLSAVRDMYHLDLARLTLTPEGFR